MAEGNFFTKLFGSSEKLFDSNQEKRIENEREEEVTDATLQDAVNFIAELQSYYYSDICKMQTDLVIENTLSENEVNFINKKIKQDQITLSEISQILEQAKQNEREYQSIWKKSIYSFYDEIEQEKLAVAQERLFKILLKLCIVNTKPELKNIIYNRITKYKKEWKINEEIQIPENYNVVLVEANNGIEKYQFGEFSKEVISDINDRTLSQKQLEQIRTMDFEIGEKINTDTLWVYISSVTRLQLNYMRRTCFIENDWEYNTNEKKSLCFDVVKLTDLKQYLRGMLQIVLSKRNHAIISIVIPTNYMLQVIGQTRKRGEKVEIFKKYCFYLRERSGMYNNNLLTARIDRRNIPEKLKFMSYNKFRKDYF